MNKYESYWIFLLSVIFYSPYLICRIIYNLKIVPGFHHSKFKNGTEFQLNIHLKIMRWIAYTAAYEIYSSTFSRIWQLQSYFLRINFNPLVTISTKLTLQQSENHFSFIDIQTFSELDKFPKILKHSHNFTHFSTRNSYSRISVPHLEIHTYLRYSQASTLESLEAQ